MAWTLEHDGVVQTLKDWGLEGVRLTQTNQQTGTLTATIRGDMMHPVPWAYTDTVILRKDGEIKWRGVAMSPRRTGQGPNEMVAVKFCDPWWWLTQGTYRQEVLDTVSNDPVRSALVALFAEIFPGLEWNHIGVGPALSGIITDCNLWHGAPKMQLGELRGDGFDISPPVADIANVTFEGAIRQVLRWVPDAVPQWDYSTEPPTLHFTQRSAATERTYDFADGVQVARDLQPRPDLQVRGVTINYITTILGRQTVVNDIAGATTGVGVLNATVNIGGSSGASGGNGSGGSEPIGVPGINQSQELVTQGIDPDSKAWWFASGYSGVEDEDDILQVGAGGMIELDPNAPENEGAGGIDGCTRWLRAGSIPGWAGRNHFRRLIVTGYLTLRFRETDDEVEIERRERRIVRLSVPGTDLGSGSAVNALQTPSSIGGTNPDTTTVFAPTGVATSLLASLGELHHEGELVWEEMECSQAIQPGDVVNIETQAPDMRAQVQAVTWDLDRGRTTALLGPPQHLSPQDYVSLLKMLRVGSPIDLSRRTFGNASSSGGGGGGFSPYTIQHPFGGNTSVSVSTTTVKSVVKDLVTGKWTEVNTEEGSITLTDKPEEEEEEGGGEEPPPEIKTNKSSPAEIKLVAGDKETTITAGKIVLKKGTGTVTIEPVEGQNITLQASLFCDGGTKKQAHILRGDGEVVT